MPFGIKLYSENQFKKLIVQEFNGTISSFLIIFFNLKFFLLCFSKLSQTTPTFLDFPKGTVI